MPFASSLCPRSHLFTAAALLGAVALPAVQAQPNHTVSAGAASIRITPLPATETSEGPSFKETSAWLTEHLTGQTAEYIAVRSHLDVNKTNIGRRGSAAPEVLQVKETISATAFDGCHLALTSERATKIQRTRITHISQFIVPLEQMDDAYIGVMEHQPERSGNQVETFMPKTTNIIHIGGPEAVIAYNSHTTTVTADRTSEGANDTGNYHLIELQTDDLATAQRVVLALRRAINLCHTSLKPEPF